ncbi:MAG: aminotransferase class I/II-fold pyridoxal phosphate-dependent enzyme [Vicinamibacterales bacterium]
MPADNVLESRVRAHLADIEARGLFRSLRPPAGIDLSSNDYLGLARHPRVVGAFAAAAREECGSTGSRLLRGERAAFSEVEARFAAFKGADRALFFSSGYLANLAVLTTFAGHDDVVFSDARNHASLIDAVRLSRASKVVFPHNDVAALERLMAETPCGGQRFVVVESIYSMDGDAAPLPAYASLCRAFGAALVVDEAHAVGVYGARGTGLVEESADSDAVLLTVNTAGKALGVCGAFVAGPEWAIEYLVQRARPFVFSTAPPPAIASALSASLDVIEAEPERRVRLLRLSAYLRAALGAAGVDVPLDSSPIVPVHVGPNEPAMAVAGALQAAGFDVRAIRPPTVAPGTARLRVSVNVGIDEATMDQFARAVANALQEAGICSAASS